MVRGWSWLLSRLYRQLADAHRYFGNLHGNRRDHGLAIENYTRAVHHDPAYARAYYSRGVLYWRELGNADRAVHDLTRALELNPSYTEAYFNRAMAHRIANEREQALADLHFYLVNGTDAYWLASATRQVADIQEEMAEQGSSAEPGAG